MCLCFCYFLTLKERLAIRLQKQISRTNIEYCLVKFCVSHIGQVYWQTDWQTLLWSEKLTLTFFTTCLQHNICAFGIDTDFPYSYSNNAEVQHTECHRPKYTMSRYTIIISPLSLCCQVIYYYSMGVRIRTGPQHPLLVVKCD